MHGVDCVRTMAVLRREDMLLALHTVSISSTWHVHTLFDDCAPNTVMCIHALRAYFDSTDVVPGNQCYVDSARSTCEAVQMRACICQLQL